jgi:DivIVA domain-containing protein
VARHPRLLDPVLATREHQQPAVARGDTVPEDPGGFAMTGDLNMPLLPSAGQIRRRDFGTVRRGYDPQEVRAYLGSIARQVEILEGELSRLRDEAASAAARSEEMADSATTYDTESGEDPYDALSKRFATLIEMADQEAEKILEDARSEATQTLGQAAREADQIRVSAQAFAEETRQEVADLLGRAKTESGRMLSGLAERRRSLVTQLEDMRGKLVEVAEDLAARIDEAVRADADDSELAYKSGDDETDGANDAETAVDSRYEDLWRKKEEPLQIPDLAPLDLDVENRDE